MSIMVTLNTPRPYSRFAQNPVPQYVEDDMEEA